MSPHDAAISSSGLTKRFGAQTAVDAIDLEVPTGAVYGFLGPNGSGKTTTIRMLLGLIHPTAGTARVLGHDVVTESGAALPWIGALVEGPAMHPHLSGRANLARLDAIDRHADPGTRKARIAAALDRVGLAAAASKKFRAYSMGMKQRLGIAAALLRPRQLLVLDEPTNGLDPQGTREVRGLVASLAEEGNTILVSSHLLSEIEQVCTHIGVMSHGKLVAQEPLATLKQRSVRQLVVQAQEPGRAAEILGSHGLAGISVQGTVLRAELADQQPSALLRELVLADVTVDSFTTQGQTLEEVFVGLTGEGFDVD